MTIGLRLAAAGLLVAAASASAQPAPVRILDVPYLQQSEALCGGAAAAMVMRFWGATGVYAESFAPLIDEAAGGIRGNALLGDLRGRGWDARSFRGSAALVASRLAAGQPVVALILDRPGFFHFVVVVAWSNGRVIYHDPARAPFRVVDERTFDRVWSEADRWTMLLLPPAEGVSPTLDGVPAAGSAMASPCDALVERGVRAAADGARAEAMEVLLAAADLCPSASAPLREAAGVRALEENWPEAARFARDAVARDPKDAHAWRILATAAYVRGDDATALNAWNAAGEPLIDLVSVQGLDRTRHGVVSDLMGLTPGVVLTRADLAAAGQRLRELPSAEAARVNYRPLGSGLASVEAVVLERPKLPTSRVSLITTSAGMVTDREVAVSAASLTGGGERIGIAWRWWEHRPRIEATFAAPSAVGVWRVEAFGEEQAYRVFDAVDVESRRGGSAALSWWTSTLTRWDVGAGLDTWGGRGRTLSVRAGLDQRLLNDRISLRASGAVHGGSLSTWTAGAGAVWRSSVSRERLVVIAAGGMQAAGDDAPRALWPGAGTGHARPIPLRAHPLLDDGRIAGEVFGRRVYHANVEARHWVRPVLKVIRLAPAGFVDAARASERMVPGGAWHVDAGVGLRLAVPGSGVLRVDLAKGLRDGATQLSAGWAIEFR